MFECWIAEGGPGLALSKKLDEVKWFLAKLIGAFTFVAVLIPTAAALWMHFDKRPAQSASMSSTLINQAHAAPSKGTP